MLELSLLVLKKLQSSKSFFFFVKLFFPRIHENKVDARTFIFLGNELPEKVFIPLFELAEAKQNFEFLEQLKIDIGKFKVRVTQQSIRKQLKTNQKKVK